MGLILENQKDINLAFVIQKINEELNMHKNNSVETFPDCDL